MRSLFFIVCVAMLCTLGISGGEAKSVGKGVLRELLGKLREMSKVDAVETTKVDAAKNVEKRYNEFGPDFAPDGDSGAGPGSLFGPDTRGPPPEIMFLMMTQPCFVLETGEGVRPLDILAMKLDCVLKIIGNKIGDMGPGGMRPGGRRPGGMGPGGMGPGGMGTGGMGQGGMGTGGMGPGQDGDGQKGGTYTGSMRPEGMGPYKGSGREEDRESGRYDTFQDDEDSVQYQGTMTCEYSHPAVQNYTSAHDGPDYKTHPK